MVAASPLPSDAELIARLNALPEGRKGEIIEGELVYPLGRQLLAIYLPWVQT